MKVMELFEAYKLDKLPKDEGYIVSSFFSYESAYTIYEIVSYSGVKAIYASNNDITFQTNGKKLYVLVEPPTYPQKGIEPYCRDRKEQIPLRFKELNIHTCKNQIRVMSSKEPQMSLSSFTIVKPEGMNFSFIFYMRDDLFSTLRVFFEKTLNQECSVPQADAKKSADAIVSTIEKSMVWGKGDGFKTE